MTGAAALSSLPGSLSRPTALLSKQNNNHK